MDNCGLWSTLTFPTLIRPSYSLDNSSMTGPIARQGPHHSAQKSTIVNLSDEITFSWKLVSVNSNAINGMFYVILILFTHAKVYYILQLLRRFPDIGPNAVPFQTQSRSNALPGPNALPGSLCPSPSLDQIPGRN